MVMTEEKTQITTKPESLYEFIQRPEIIQRFAGALGNDERARAFAQSVIVLVQNAEPSDYSLQNCSYTSIVRAAVRAATLRVSVDPAARQAWLVPRKNKKGVLEACFQFHYMEERNRAMRTGRYKFINVAAVYEGETVFENIYTGLHHVQLANGLMTQPTPVNFSDGWVPVGSRGKTVIGWLGYSETFRGARQTVYMSCKDIEEFMNGVQDWGTGTASWRKFRETMERKTVLRALLRKEDTSAPDMQEVNAVMAAAEEAENTVDGEAEYVYDDAAQVPPEEPPQITPLAQTVPLASKPLPVHEAPPLAEAGLKGTTSYTPGAGFKKALTYDHVKVYIVRGRPLMSYTDDELREHTLWEKCAASTKEAISIVLAHRAELAKQEAEKKAQQ